MFQLKKLLAMSFGFLLILCTGLCSAGCGEDSGKPKKYDATVKIYCKADGGRAGFGDGSDYCTEWVFSPDVNEMHIEQEYDGREYRFYVYSYQLEKHPEWSKFWLNPDGHNGFYTSLHYVNQRYDQPSPEVICERGEYYYTFQTDTVSQFIEFRTIYLYVTVT